MTSMHRSIPDLISPLSPDTIMKETFPEDCRNLNVTEAHKMMLALQKLLDDTTQSMTGNSCRNIAFRVLNFLSKKCDQFVSIPIIKIQGDTEVVDRGGCGTISKGYHEGKIVAIKAITRYSSQNDTTTPDMALRREILLWRQLSAHHHPNILPLLGVTDTRFSKIKMVAPWHENGNLLKYTQKHENDQVNRLELLLQTCTALKFMHEHVPVIVHADLKCANVLVNDRGEACLCDFGLATVRHNGASLTSHLEGGTIRWMAPEQLQPESDTPEHDPNEKSDRATCFSDIWSFGMLCLELLTEECPFPDKALDFAVVLGLMQGERPKSPNRTARRYGLGDELWGALHRCWSEEPKTRPSLHSLQKLLGKLAKEWCLPLPDDEQQHIAVSFTVRKDVCPHIIGKNHIRLNQLQTEFGVVIKITQQDVLICGPKGNVEEARKRIEAISTTQMDFVEERIRIPSSIHGYLIGKNGVRVRRLEAMHEVKVSFLDEDRVIVRGPKELVSRAIMEIQQSIDIDREFSSQRQMNVSQRLARRLELQASDVKKSNGLDNFSVSSVESSDGRYLVSFRGSPASLDKTEESIKALFVSLKGETRKKIPLPRSLVGVVFGTHKTRWSDMVIRYGGPADKNIQRDIIEIDGNSEQAILRGDRLLVESLAIEIAEIVSSSDRKVYGYPISSRYHKILQPYLVDIENRTKTTILLSTHTQFARYSDPINLSEVKLPEDLIKIIGTQETYNQAVGELRTCLDKIRDKEMIIEISLKYRHAIYQHVRERFHELGIRISPSPSSWPAEFKPLGPLSGTVDWKVSKRFRNDLGYCRWTLRGTSKANIQTGYALIQEAYKRVREEKYIGFLFIDPTKHGLIVGSGGGTLQNIQKHTNTRIIVPKKDSTEGAIQIIGKEWDIKSARVEILALLNPPTTTLFNNSYNAQTR